LAKDDFSATPAGIFHTQLDQTDFTEDTEPKPQSSQSGQGVWLRDLGSKLGALLGEKEFIEERVNDAGLAPPVNERRGPGDLSVD
jgi:hypothetical protein